jgi:hypothetical protein
MDRQLCLNWLACEAVDGPRQYAPLAREIAGAIMNETDDVSLDAMKWLDRLAAPGSRWSRQAQACLDEIDRLGRRDTIETAPWFESEVASA